MFTCGPKNQQKSLSKQILNKSRSDPVTHIGQGLFFLNIQDIDSFNLNIRIHVDDDSNFIC